MKKIKGLVFNLWAIVYILLNVFMIYILFDKEYSFSESIIIWLIINIPTIVLIRSQFNYLLYDQKEIIIKNQLVNLKTEIININQIVNIKISGGMYSTLLIVTLNNYKKKKINISILPIKEVEKLIEFVRKKNGLSE